jgi:hypothetical protein
MSEMNDSASPFAGGLNSSNPDFPPSSATGFSFQAESTFRGSVSFSETPLTVEADARSIASFGVSDAGATFGGSDDTRAVEEVEDDERFSDGTASDTRSVFGSSSAGTAFITEPPSSSDGRASVTDSGPFDHRSDTSSAIEVFESTSNVLNMFEGDGSVAASAVAEEDEANVPGINPFSTSSEMFSSSPFGSSGPVHEQPSPPTGEEFVPSAASLFGSSPEKPSPFESIPSPAGVSQRSGSAMYVHPPELPTVAASDLFAGSPPMAGIGFDQVQHRGSFFLFVLANAL